MVARPSMNWSLSDPVPLWQHRFSWSSGRSVNRPPKRLDRRIAKSECRLTTRSRYVDSDGQSRSFIESHDATAKLAKMVGWLFLLCNVDRWNLAHPGLPGVLRHSVKLRTSAPGYIYERACREELLDSGVDILQCVIFFEARLEMYPGWKSPARALSTTNNSCRAARRCLFKMCVQINNAFFRLLWLAAFTWGSDRIDLGSVSPAVSGQKLTAAETTRYSSCASRARRDNRVAMSCTGPYFTVSWNCTDDHITPAHRLPFNFWPTPFSSSVKLAKRCI
jgi:hypothetical protein